MNQNLLQQKLADLEQQFSTLQHLSNGVQGQSSDSLPKVIATLQKSLEELRATAAKVPGDEGTSTMALAPSSGEYSSEDRPTRGMRFRALAERGQVLVRIMGTETKCRWTNPAWLEFTGRGHEEDQLKAAIVDDGVGMETDVAAAQGSGLFSIRERLNHVGGSMRIESAPGKGTKVLLSAPLTNGEKKREKVNA